VSNTSSTSYQAPGRVSVVRTAVAALFVLAGIAWVVVYDTKGNNDPKKMTWMYDLGDWNWLIGFGLLFLGLIMLSHRGTPLGRGRGIVIGMLGCFLIGLIWIVLYYFTANASNVPLFTDLGSYNLVVGIAFMATGFVYATKWE
jgi:drug/metabolite transporter (DMT)-like permease